MTEHKGLNLCDICEKRYPECDANVCGMMFEDETGNDNVISCAWYRSPVYKAIREAREKSGLSQNALGKISGVPTRNINYWEHGNGDPPISAILKMANSLGMAVGEFLEERRDSE